MVKTAQASSLERAKLKTKKLREQKIKNKNSLAAKRAEMGEREYIQHMMKVNEKTTKEKLDLALWDYKNKQFPPSRLNYLRNLLKARINEEINEEEKNKLEVILNGLTS